MLLFSEVGMPLTQHYSVYKGGLPHAVFRTDYLSRIRSLLPPPEGDDTPPDTGSVLTPKSVRRQHRVTQPKWLFSEAVGEGAASDRANPAEMAGETVIDFRPPMLPVSIPLSGLSPAMISGARNCMQFNGPEETGQSIMNMDTNEITIDRIIGFDWKDTGTDVEDELLTPVSSPPQIAVSAIPRVGTADPFGRGEGFDMELAKVMCDVSVLPSLVSPLQEVEEPSRPNASSYAAPAVPELETILESPGYTVPEERGCQSLHQCRRWSAWRRGVSCSHYRNHFRHRPWNQPSPRR